MQTPQSNEQVAYSLMMLVINRAKSEDYRSKPELLSLYGECLDTVQGKKVESFQPDKEVPPPDSSAGLERVKRKFNFDA